MEDCREVLLTFKKHLTEAKAKKESEVKKSVVSWVVLFTTLVSWLQIALLITIESYYRLEVQMSTT